MVCAVMDTPVGSLCLAEEGGALTQVYLPGSAFPVLAREDSPLLQRAAAQLTEYFAGSRRTFDLPLAPRGTEFQRTVWQALAEVPYGRTVTYRQLAEQIGRPKAARAVGLAMRTNPLAIFLPCHRVVGSDGSLTGYAGGLAMKEHLLALERGDNN